MDPIIQIITRLNCKSGVEMSSKHKQFRFSHTHVYTQRGHLANCFLGWLYYILQLLISCSFASSQVLIRSLSTFFSTHYLLHFFFYISSPPTGSRPTFVKWDGVKDRNKREGWTNCFWSNLLHINKVQTRWWWCALRQSGSFWGGQKGQIPASEERSVAEKKNTKISRHEKDGTCFIFLCVLKHRHP